MRRSLASLLTIGLSLVLITPVLAAEFRGGDSVQITAPIGDDLYAAGGTITIGQSVRGDLIVAGGDVTVSALVQADIIAAGGTVRLENNVTDDVRVAGGTVTIRGNIGDDLIVAGGTIDIDRATTVKGDLVVMGGTARVLGTINGNVYVRGGKVRLEGTVNGAMDVETGDVTFAGIVRGPVSVSSEKITIAPTAGFYQGVRYWSDAGQLNFGQSIKGGTATYDATLGQSRAVAPATGAMTALAGMFSLYSFLAGLLLIVLLVLVARHFTHDSGKRLLAKPWMSLLWGFLFFAVTPIAILILMISLIGIPLALFALSIYLFSWIFASPITAVVLASAIRERTKSKWGKGMLILVSAGLLIVLQLLTWIPFIGWTIKLAAYFFGVGAYAWTKWEAYRKIV